MTKKLFGIYVGTALAFGGLILEVTSINAYEHRHHGVQSTPVAPIVVDIAKSMLDRKN